VGDRVAYLTVKGRYWGQRDPHWRLVAVLRVIQRFAAHSVAAAWYAEQGLSLPSNCLVPGNAPKPFDLTNGNPPAAVRARVEAAVDSEGAIRLWDAVYRRRVALHPMMLATEPEFLELHRPPEVHVQDLRSIFGRIPATLNPPTVECGQLDALIELARGSAAGPV
jgi:hypothetical protein